MTNREHILKDIQQEIQEELQEIAPLLAQGQNKDRAYRVPQNYFSSLKADDILAIAKEKDRTEYAVPEDYFTGLQDKMADRIEKEKDIDLSQNKSIGSVLTRRIAMLSSIAASLLLLVYVSTNYDELSSPTDFTDSEIELYIEDAIDDMDLDDLLVLQETDEGDQELYVDEEELVDYYIEQNIYTLEEEFLSEIID